MKLSSNLLRFLSYSEVALLIVVIIPDLGSKASIEAVLTDFHGNWKKENVPII